MSIGFTNYQSKNKQPSTLLSHTQLGFEHMFLVIDIDLWLGSFMLRRARTGNSVDPPQKQFTEIDLRLESFQDYNRRNKSVLWDFLGMSENQNRCIGTKKFRSRYKSIKNQLFR